jgi:signal transduction histidine kinase
MKDVLGRGRAVQQRRLPQPTREGSIRVYDLKAFPLQIEGVPRAGAVIVRHDVTRRIRLEEQLVRHARTSSLARLGAAVAHEIRNPLNSISMNLQLIQEWVGEGEEIPREEVVETVEVVRDEIRRLDRIIKDFLQFSRPPAPRVRPEEPATVVDSTLRLIGEEARRSGVAVVREIDANLPPVRMDRDQFSQALYNLVLNAIQEMPDGGTLTVGIRRGKDFVQYTVRDTGPGLAPQEEKDRLFDLFFSTKEGGHGLGLAIANRIVERHGGRLVAENHPEGGAEFSIYLPLGSIESVGEEGGGDRMPGSEKDG